MSAFKTSPAGYDLIKYFEGLAKKVYDKGGDWTGMVKAYRPSPDDNWTIGYGQEGHLFPGTDGEMEVTETLVITEQQAEDALYFFVMNVVEPLVNRHFTPETQGEYDALVSWCYNIRMGRLERGEYTLPKVFNQKPRDFDAIIDWWLKYVNPKTMVEQGLYRRRLAELCLMFGWPWIYAVSAVLKRSNGVIVERTDPQHILAMAEKAADRPMTTDELNAAELARLRGEAPPARQAAPPPPKPKPAPASPPVPVPVEAPKLDVTAPPKPMEQSTTAKGMSNKDSGKETAAIGAVTTTGVFAMLPYAEKIAAFAERTNPQVIMVSIGVVTAVVLAVGVVRWWVGKMQMYDGRLNATETKI